jgi:hypothetical protein
VRGGTDVRVCEERIKFSTVGGREDSTGFGGSEESKIGKLDF